MVFRVRTSNDVLVQQVIFNTTNWLQYCRTSYYHTRLSTSRLTLSGSSTHTLQLLHSLSLTSQLTLYDFLTNTPWASIPLSSLSPTTHVYREGPWPGSRRPFLQNYSLEGPTTHWWTRRRLGSCDIVYG